MNYWKLTSQFLGLILGITLAVGCSNRLDPMSTSANDSTTECSKRAASALGYEGEVCYEVRGELAVFQDDIVLGKADELRDQPEDLSLQGFGVSTTSYLWPGGIVPYVLGDARAKASDVMEAIKYVNDRTAQTGVRLIPRTNQAYYIRITTFHNCTQSSFVGVAHGLGYRRIAGQSVELNTCKASNFTSLLRHELGHVFGLQHEHMRCDRDKYIRINLSNVISSKHSQYAKICNLKMQNTYLDDYDTPYDYNSVMHYAGMHNSTNGKAVITRTDTGSSSNLGSKFWSATDILTLSRMYK